MPRLFGRSWTREELLSYVGDMEQVAGIISARLDSGRAAGVRALDFNCGDGMRFMVLPDRCLDIPHLEYRGVPLVWLSPTGIVAPEYYEPQGKGWLRSFFGGLLTTCGLTQVGTPCVDGDEQLGQHGRISNIAAEEVAASATWQGDDYVLSVRGTMREASFYGEDLRLTRSITTQVGSRTISIHDRVENMGNQTTPFMILYHSNAGFPLLGPGARLIVADIEVQPKDDHSRAGLAEHTRYAPPTDGWSEQNYWHNVRPNAEGYCEAAIVNESLELPFGRGLGLAIRWRKDQLWNLVQWKQLGIGDYVGAIEPANCHTLGRCKERELGTLEHIAPHEVREFDVEYTVLVGGEEIVAFEGRQPGA